MERYIPGVGRSAIQLMIKWSVLRQLLADLKDEKEINLFINFESILRNLCKIKNLGLLVNFYLQKVVIELESSVLNLVAHYRGFFKKHGIKCNIYFYYTDLSCENSQLMKNEIKFYRNYYYNKYKQNPEFKNIFRLLQIIVPDLKLITQFIDGVYFITTKEIDSSLVPKLLSSDIQSIVLTEDIFDTIYLFDNIKVLYIKRDFNKNSQSVVFSSPAEIADKILNYDNPFELIVFNSELYFKLLLTFNGSQVRNLQSLSSDGCSIINFAENLRNKIKEGVLLENFKSLSSVLSFLPKKVQSELSQSFKGFDLNVHLSQVNELIKEELKEQIVDHFDFDSIMSLNNQRFLEFPVNLIDLCY